MITFDELDIVLRKKQDRTIAAVPGLGLHAHGRDVPSALEALEQKKAALIADIQAGLVDADLVLKAAQQRPPESPRAANVGMFALKASIFIVLAVFGALVAATLVSAKLEAAIDRARFAALSTLYQALEGSFATKVEGFIERAAAPEKEPSPERKQKLQQNVRTLADRWRPIVTEALSVLSNERTTEMPSEKRAASEQTAKPAQ